MKWHGENIYHGRFFDMFAKKLISQKELVDVQNSTPQKRYENK